MLPRVAHPWAACQAFQACRAFLVPQAFRVALASQVARTVLVALTVWWVGPWPPKALVIFKTAPGPISSSSPASPSASLTAHPRPRFLWREGTPARRQRVWVDPDALWALQRKQVGKVKTAGLHQASRQRGLGAVIATARGTNLRWRRPSKAAERSRASRAPRVPCPSRGAAFGPFNKNLQDKSP